MTLDDEVPVEAFAQATVELVHEMNARALAQFEDCLRAWLAAEGIAPARIDVYLAEVLPRVRQYVAEHETVVIRKINGDALH